MGEELPQSLSGWSVDFSSRPAKPAVGRGWSPTGGIVLAPAGEPPADRPSKAR